MWLHEAPPGLGSPGLSPRGSYCSQELEGYRCHIQTGQFQESLIKATVGCEETIVSRDTIVRPFQILDLKVSGEEQSPGPRDRVGCVERTT